MSRRLCHPRLTIAGKRNTPQMSVTIASRRFSELPEPAFRFSGHQTFPLRIAWLPKAIREIQIG